MSEGVRHHVAATPLLQRVVSDRTRRSQSFIDVAGHYDDPRMREAVAELKKFCPLVKWLGSYPIVLP